MSNIFPFIEGNIRLEIPESALSAGDGIILDLDECDFIVEDANTIGYKRFKQARPQVEYTIAGGSAISYSFFEAKYEFEMSLQITPNKWATLHSILEEQEKRVRTRSTSVVEVKLLDRRIADVYRLPRTRARDGSAISIPSLTLPSGSEASFSWFSVLFDYDQQYFDFLLKTGGTEVDGLLTVELTGRELDLIGITEDTTIF